MVGGPSRPLISNEHLLTVAHHSTTALSLSFFFEATQTKENFLCHYFAAQTWKLVYESSPCLSFSDISG